MYEMILQALGGGEVTPAMQEYAYITGCVILVLTCWAFVKVADWLFRGWR